MTKPGIFVDNIKKPSKPHRQINKNDIPTQKEIETRIYQIKKLKELGIDTNVLDTDNNVDSTDYEEDIDKLKASIIIMQGKELPKELEQKLLEKKASKNKKVERL